MIYKIVVDKQPRDNPSSEKKEYQIDIEELRRKGDVYDSLIITADGDYVMRRLELTEYHVLKVLPSEIKQPIPNLNIELFQGTNYIYLSDLDGNKLYAEYMVQNDFTNSFATKIELSTAITQTSTAINLLASKKLDKDEFATELEVNSEAVKVAWNKISEYIQMMILNNNASFVILDESKNPLMSLDKTGQHFYGGNSIFGEMGVQTKDNKKYISFSVEGNYDEELQNGMAWGMKTKSDGRFFPILSLEHFYLPPYGSDNGYGELMLNGCNLILASIGSGIISGNIKMFGDPGGRSLYFYDIDNNSYLLSISSENQYLPGSTFGNLEMLNGRVEFYANEAGDCSFVLETDPNNKKRNLLLSSDGYIRCNSIYCAGDYADITCTGYITAKGFIDDSKEEMKKNIEKYDENALDEILNTDIYKFNYKTDDDSEKKRIGFVIGEKYNYSKEITNDDRGANLYSMVSVAYKAIQEQQQQIEELKHEIEKLKGEKENG